MTFQRPARAVETLQPVGRHPELQEALMMTMTIYDDYEDDNGNDNDEKNRNDNTNHRNQRAKSPLQTREINRSTQIIIASVNIFNINCSYRRDNYHCLCHHHDHRDLQVL